MFFRSQGRCDVLSDLAVHSARQDSDAALRYLKFAVGQASAACKSSRDTRNPESKNRDARPDAPAKFGRSKH